MVAFDVSAVAVLALFLARGGMQLYPLGVLLCLFLFAINMLFAWTLTGRQAKDSGGKASAPWYLWLVAAVFTPAGIGAIVFFFKEPSLPHGTPGCRHFAS
jgi:hypothetical protein